MGKPARRTRLGAALVSGAAHLLVLAVLASQAPILPEHPEDAGAPEPIIPILILPRTPRQEAGARTSEAPVRLHRRTFRNRMLEPPPLGAPAPLLAPRAPLAPEAEEATSSAPSRLPPGAGLSPGLQAALRARIGCGERAGVRLTADERAGCDERLGRGAATATPIPAPLAPEIRAYYDAVVAARAADTQQAPLKARGKLGMFEVMPTNSTGHGPGIGCHISFGGPGAGVHRPAHGLKLGPLPCFIVPPAGSLTPDVDVQNPDEVVQGKHGP